MKISFAKKTIKILTAAIFGVFVLVSFNFLLETRIVYAEAAYFVEEETYFNGYYEVKKTTTVYEDENGKEITRVEEVPTDASYGNGTIKESTGEYTRGGYINENGDYVWNDESSWYVLSPTVENTGNGSEKFTYTLLQPLPQEGEDLRENVTLEEYLTWAYKFVLALAGFLAVMMIVIGGVEWIISGANESMRSEAKKRISNAIWGLVMALAAYLVLYTINPSLVDFENNQFFKEKETTDSENENNVPLVEGQGGEFGGTGATGSW